MFSLQTSRQLVLTILASLVLSAVFLPSAVRATEMKGQDILWDCDDLPEDADAKRLMLWIRCNGYIQGAHDMMVYLLAFYDNDLYCAPKEGLSVDQTRRIVVKWIKANPEAMNRSARQVIEFALRAAFPCKRKPQQQRGTAPPAPSTAR